MQDLFSRRNSLPCSSLKYDSFSYECKLQILNIAVAFFERNSLSPFAEMHFWPPLQNLVKDEHGKDSLYAEHLHKVLGGRVSAYSEVSEYLLQLNDLNKSLDVVELIFGFMLEVAESSRNEGYIYQAYPIELAVENLNKRLAQHCMGYKFVDGIILRIDNELLYDLISKELFPLLLNSTYQNINDEFLQAYRHFRNGDYEDCIVNCNKAFESSLKVICSVNGYSYEQSFTAPKLVKVLMDNNFFPSILFQYITGVRKTLEEGVSVIRNNVGGHGKGVLEKKADENLTSYSLNITGSSIKFLLGILDNK